ncbi:transcriptional regulator, propionate catabolism operon regulatory protein [Desulfotomaculum arcticum]|uniref:Transcriptional regulator, propionate catabolism operon regulatory protein n=1 Tax=Desulfotruncus arcticus DSM 17038 TaxID=1121424 RepID=A0A1I2YPQ8_9FIRM|nr:sigma 54-interacting transcriptional regulator [Desulfotruncus arcticus]SFH27460.1 transcriptional regulator, propionate catabolism operon regulatory protein [Desulfotomaculum arcticum] [Desulfotruncus arcticus DSM 17038]
MNIVIFNSHRLNNEIKKVYNEIQTYCYFDIQIIEEMFDKALLIAKKLELQDSVDAIITGGATGEMMRDKINIPVVSFSVTGFDLLKTLMNAKTDSTDTVAVVNFKKSYQELRYIEELLKIRLDEYVYNDQHELLNIINKIRKKGYDFVVGTTIICDLATEHGIRNYVVYSREAIMNAMKTACELVITRRQELEKIERLKAILNFAYCGIIATDEKGLIKMFNPAVQKILRMEPAFALEKHIDQVAPGLQLTRALHSESPQIDQIKKIGNLNILVTHVPIIVKGNVKGIVATCQDVNTLQQTEARVRQKLHKKGLYAKNKFTDIIGKCIRIQETVARAKSYAVSDSTILIYGETGTGKELFAQSIHNYSRRSNQPFIAINCAALPESLLESELFGYEDGAFTGARRGGKAGLFELAHLGTIFLDEISEIPLKMQARLLRVLQEKEIMRIGSDKVINVNIRIISATNRNLWHRVQEGLFREDLFYRLNVLKLDLPPLRERIDDIPLLLNNLNLPKALDPYVSLIISKFNNLYWPGNIRQMENIIERLMVIFQGFKGMVSKVEFMQILDEVTENIPLVDAMKTRTSIPTSLNACSERKVTDESILKVLRDVNGNKVAAAKKLGVSRMTLWRWLKKINI